MAQNDSKKRQDKPKRDKPPKHESRIHVTENPFTLHIDDTPENIARILMTAPPKKADEWDYLRKRK